MLQLQDAVPSSETSNGEELLCRAFSYHLEIYELDSTGCVYSRLGAKRISLSCSLPRGTAGTITPYRAVISLQSRGNNNFSDEQEDDAHD